MSRTVSDFLIDRMMEWGTHRIYGYPGDGIGGFFGALERAEDKDDKPLRLIRPTHEEMASLMAVAHAKFTGEVGVCVATSGPGAFHLINGLYDAKMDNQPVVAIVGQQARVALGSDFQQESNLETTFADVAVYVKTISTPMQTQLVIDRAYRIAKASRGPAVVILPNDIQKLPFEEPAAEHFVSRTGVGHASTRITPPADEIKKAAEILNSGKKVAIMVGQGAMDATDEILEVAKKTGAGVITALLGKAVIPADVPFYTHHLGLLGSKPSYDMMMNCDTLLMVGTNFPYGEFMPPTGQARGIQIDLQQRHLSLRYPMEVNLWGDSKTTLTELLLYLKQKEDLSWQEEIIDNMKEWRDINYREVMVDAEPINPRRAFYEMNKRLPLDSIITADAGSTADWYGHHVDMKRGMMGNLSGRLATMLAAMPYALAAKFAFPERPVICTIGDGAMQMLGMNGLISVKRYWEEWKNPTFIVFVLHNNDLAQVSWEMRIEDGNPRYETSQKVESMNYAAYAETLGLKGIYVDDPNRLEEAWDEAFAADQPVVIDIVTDPNVPPLPPHISFKQAKNYTYAMLKGRDPQAGGALKESVKGVMAEVSGKIQHVFHKDDDRDDS